MDTGDASATLRWAIRGCLAGFLALCILGCTPRSVRPPVPLTDSDGAHQHRATITVLSLGKISPMEHWGRWNLMMTIEISATSQRLVMRLGTTLWASLYDQPAKFVWITRSNGRELWLGGAPQITPPFGSSIVGFPQYRALKTHEVTEVASDCFTATIGMTVPSYELPSGEVTIAFDGEALRARIGGSERWPSIPEGGIYCPAATLIAPAPTQAGSAPCAKPQSGGGMGAIP